MKKQLVTNAESRRRILEKIREQRMEIAEISEISQSPLALVDTGVKAIRFLYSHPTLTAGSVAALIALRRKSIVGLALGGWRFMYLYPSILSVGLKFLPLLFRSAKKHP